jgi:hypothetical protein
VNANDPAPAVVDEAIVPASVDAAETSVNDAPEAVPDVIPVVPYEAEPELTMFSDAVTATQPPVGVSVAPRNPPLIVNELDPAAVVVRPTCTVTAELTAGDDVAVVALIAETNAAVAAFAGATVTRVEPSAATATSAMRFFNEIVFTIFLSLSQIKDFLLSGW